MTRFRLDPSTRLAQETSQGTSLLLGGSPLRLFRLSATGRQRFEELASGSDVDPSGRLLERLVESGAIHPEPRLERSRLADTTVVIPTYAPDHARLQELVVSCGDAALVIVVDDASPEPVAAVGGARLIRLAVNRGPGAARNVGAREATTAFVAFVDDDVTIASREWLPLLLGHFDDPAVVAVAPRVRSRSGVSSLAAFERDHSPLDLGPLAGIVGPGRRVAYVPAAALIVRRQEFEAAGGFDVELRVGEDVDLVWRLGGGERRCRYEPAAEVEHEPRPSWKALAAQRFAYGTSAAPLATRHRAALAPVRTTGWSAAICVLLTVKRPVLAGGLAAFTAIALARKVPDLGGREALRLTVRGHVYAGRTIAGAVRRVWWPILAVGALGSRWCRRVLVLSVATAVADWGLDPRRLMPGLADDAVYGTGVWKGVVTEGDAGPLIPEIISWP